MIVVGDNGLVIRSLLRSLERAISFVLAPHVLQVKPGWPHHIACESESEEEVPTD